MAEADVALARVGAGESRRKQGRQAQGKAAWALSSAAMPPWPSSAVGADDPRAGADQDRVPAELARPRHRGRRPGDRLVLAAVGGRGRDVTAEQLALAQLGDVAADSEPGSAPPPVWT